MLLLGRICKLEKANVFCNHSEVLKLIKLAPLPISVSPLLTLLTHVHKYTHAHYFSGFLSLTFSSASHVEFLSFNYSVISFLLSALCLTSGLLSNCSFFHAAKDLDTEKYVHLVSVCFLLHAHTPTHSYTHIHIWGLWMIMQDFPHVWRNRSVRTIFRAVTSSEREWDMLDNALAKVSRL